MRKKKTIIKFLFAAAATVVIASGCEKIVHGYLSKDVFYQQNPFAVQQGLAVASEPLQENGSTDPLIVKLLALRDSAGNDADSILMKPRTITTFTGSILNTDSTLALLHAKLKDSMASPFSLDSLGGRLQFTMATADVPAGTYNMDINVSNARSSEVLTNACQIIIEPLATTYTQAYQRIEYFDASLNLLSTYLTGDLSDVSYIYADTTQVIMKFEDANGKPFDPAKGEVTVYKPNYPTLQNWDPYYPAINTDTSIVYTLPNTGITFPYFNLAFANDGSTFNGNGNAVIYYKIPNTTNTSNENAQVCLVFQFLAKGIYTVTVHFDQLVHS